MSKTHKPDTAAPPRKRRAKTSAPVAARAAPLRHSLAVCLRAANPHPPPAALCAHPRPSRQPPRSAPLLTAAPPTVCAPAISGSTHPTSSPSLFPNRKKRSCPSPTSAEFFSARRSTARHRKSRCAWSRAKRSITLRGSKLLEARLRAAIARRKPMLDAANDACRLCFSEADELPGLIADKYGDLVVLQFLTKGLLAAGVSETCVRVLREELTPAAILERPDPRIRELEGLARAQRRSVVACRSRAARRSHASFISTASSFTTTPMPARRPAPFSISAPTTLPRSNGRSVSEPTGRALDVCCYQGGFALHLAQVCRQVTGIDASRASLEVAERNLAGQSRPRISKRATSTGSRPTPSRFCATGPQAGENFDAIVLDPPAFAKSKRAVEGALRGYKELNLRALKMLRPGGLLVTCSCSHHVSWADLEAAVAAAAADASRRVRLLERRGAAPDHPVVLNLPETEYLKCLVLEVE